MCLWLDMTVVSAAVVISDFILPSKFLQYSQVEVASYLCNSCKLLLQVERDYNAMRHFRQFLTLFSPRCKFLHCSLRCRWSHMWHSYTLTCDTITLPHVTLAYCHMWHWHLWHSHMWHVTPTFACKSTIAACFWCLFAAISRKNHNKSLSCALKYWSNY